MLRVVSRALHGRPGGFHVLADPGDRVASAHQQRGGEQGKEEKFAHGQSFSLSSANQNVVLDSIRYG